MNELIEFIKEQLKTNQFFSGAALGGILVGMFHYLKNLPIFIYNQIKRNIIFRTYIDDTDELYAVFNNFLYKNYPKKFKSVTAKYDHVNDYEKKNINGDLNYEFRTGYLLIWYKGFPYYIQKTRDKLDGAKDLYNVYKNDFCIYSFSSKRNDKFINDVLVNHQNSIKELKKVKVYLVDKWSNGIKLYKEYQPSPLGTIILNDDKKDILLNDITEFYNKKEWYIRRGKSYKRIYCFHGDPGNGKSSFIPAIAKLFNKDILYLNLSSIASDDDLMKAFSQINENYILIIEDLHTIYDKETPISDKIKISHSLLLNLLSGILEIEGLVCFFTTNEIDKMSSALLRRMDHVEEFTNPNHESVIKYLEMFYETDDFTINYNKNLSFSAIQNICIENKDDIDATIKILEKQ